MKILQIMPGYVESYYCENFLRDNSLVRAFRQLGHDVLMVPLYMPAHLDLSQPVRQTEIFMGGINVYLQQKFSGQSASNQQQKMMGYFMPVFMVLFFNTFPSGLNLYYSLFNILSVVQTKYLSDGFFSKKKSEKANS